MCFHVSQHAEARWQLTGVPSHHEVSNDRTQCLCPLEPTHWPLLLLQNHLILRMKVYLLVFCERNEGGKERGKNVRKEEEKLRRIGERKGGRREEECQVGKEGGERTAGSVSGISSPGLWLRKQRSYFDGRYLSGLWCWSPGITPPVRVTSPLGHHLAQDSCNVNSLYPPPPIYHLVSPWALPLLFCSYPKVSVPIPLRGWGLLLSSCLVASAFCSIVACLEGMMRFLCCVILRSYCLAFSSLITCMIVYMSLS